MSKFNESDHPRAPDGTFGAGLRKIGGVTATAPGRPNTPDIEHLNALELRLHNETTRLKSAKTTKERAHRAVWVAQAQKELDGEKERLGLTGGNEEIDLSDEELLAELGADEIDLEEDCELTASDSAVPLAFDKSMRRVDLDGHLHIETTTISKANVCPYVGREINDNVALGLDPNKVYMLYRDRAALAASAKTFENKPLMRMHVGVTAAEPHKMTRVGTLSNVRYEHPLLVAAVTIWDGEAIAALEAQELAHLSSGYRYKALMVPGTIDGVKYDGRMVDIVGNHVAMVEAGRIGPDALISDELPQELAHMKVTTLVAALAPFLATDAKPADVEAGITAALALDRKAKKDAEDKAACDKAAKDALVKSPAGEDEMDDDIDAEDEEDAKAKAAAKKAAKDKAAKDGNWGLGGKDGKKAMDEAIATGVAAAIAANDALHVARREVEPILGAVAFDSAEQVYKAALDKLGVATDGVHPSAFAYMVKTAKTAAAAPALATDGAGDGKTLSMSEAFPGFDRIRR